jgi:16S rRNA processing protein RimM
MSLLLVGTLGKARGLKGELFVLAYHPDSPHWEVGRTLYVLPVGTAALDETGILDSKPDLETRIEVVQVGAKGRLVLRLEAVRTRSAAEDLRNCPVAISLDSLESPASDEFYYHEVVGWTVNDRDGVKVGTVVRAVETYLDLVEVRPVAGGETFFIPVVNDIVIAIDRENKVLVVNMMEGLIP